MRNISAWAIRHPVTPIVLFVVLFFMGVVAFIRLPINLNPDVSFPAVNVDITEPGAAPTEMETQIAQRVEGSISSIGAVRHIVTFITEGSVHIGIEFQIGTPIDRAVTDVRDAVAKVRSDLPQGILEPQVSRQDVDGGAFIYYALSTTSMTPEQLSWAIDNTITKRLLAISGVAQVQRIGGVDREIRVELDPGRLQAMGLTAVQVNDQLRQLNMDAAGGRAQVGGGEQAIRVLGGAKTAGQLGDTQIIVAGGKFVRLREIAEVRDGIAEIRGIARLNGRSATAFGVFKARGASDVSTAKAVQVELDKILVENPALHLQTIFTTVEHTIATYHSSLEALVEGSILAVVVVWFFLRSWRATLISALAIPLSAIPTFAFMQFMGFTLNTITLLGLSLVAGVLVDDAIVEIENIVRHMRMGKSGFQAALDAADEIGLAVVATSFTIIAVFLPVSFMSGISGQYFKQFGLTVATAVFISLLVARMITPVLAAYGLHSDSLVVHNSDGPIMTRYLQALNWCVANRWKTIAAGAVFFLLSVGGLMAIPKAFVPAEDFATSIVNVELPPGGTLEDTERVSGAAAALVRKSPEVTDTVEFIGGDGDNLRTATIFVSLVPRDKRGVSEKEWEQRLQPQLSQVPDGHLSFNGQNFGGRDISLYLVGDDPALVEIAGHKVLDEMRAMPELQDARINGDLPRPEIVVHPRLDIAAQLGVSVQNISQTIRIATLGDLPQNGAKFSLTDRQIPIRVSLPESARHDLTTLENLPVPTASGASVPLKTVADLSFGQGPSAVRRYNMSRRVFLDADMVPGVELGTANTKVHALPALKKLPAGVHLVETGNTEFMTELVDGFLLAIGAGILMVLAVLVLLFVRVFQPITILSALPLSLGGAVLALLLTGVPFSLPVMIGILMLMGIVAKNSILLVDFAIEEMRAGKPRNEAIMQAGHKRARPIVMTTVAMVAGMLPIALGWGGDSDFRSPMAIAVIGGLITSTMLTLVIVPAVFTLFDDIERWVGPKATALLAGTQALGRASPELASDRPKLGPSAAGAEPGV
ncbi:MAG TPA: efflux RND transporter permease subunit [Steroidobacteraceae bacterium]|nr:efflux RND transporter permease subunit [Steroidobacteraceae bacterium]